MVVPDRSSELATLTFWAPNTVSPDTGGFSVHMDSRVSLVLQPLSQTSISLKMGAWGLVAPDTVGSHPSEFSVAHRTGFRVVSQFDENAFNA